MSTAAREPGRQRRQRLKQSWKRANNFKLGFAGLAGVVLLVAGHWHLAVAVVLLAWLLYELFWCERLYFEPHSDYRFNFAPTHREQVELESGAGGTVELRGIRSDASTHTVLLEINLRHSLGGIIFDPYVVIDGGQRQYFERGVSGCRYINLSHAGRKGADEKIGLKFCRCTTDSPTATALSFRNPDLRDRKIMVVAPHADDAEIAAFGLYSEHAAQSLIVTITAGEVEAGHYRALTGGDREASRLKGLLRSWDSVAVPQWAGLRKRQAIQLGYFTLTLGEMHREPESAVTSPASGVEDPRVFRAFNETPLRSDGLGVSTWDALVGDLAELIEVFEPSAIVTPHPRYDAHDDHYFSSLALCEALGKTQHEVEDFMLYANHYRETEAFPFGRMGSLVAMPPLLDGELRDEHVYSHELQPERQRMKLMALGMMHDLNVPPSFKKRLRARLQQWFLGRERCAYGEDDFFRRAVRANEVFFVCDRQQFEDLTLADERALESEHG